MSGIGFSCETCPAFLKDDDKGGLCRRYPPTVHIVPGKLIGEMRPVNMLPAVAVDHWCLEHPSAKAMAAVPIDSRLGGEAQGEA